MGALGLPVAKSKIIDFAGKHVLATERFDRTWTKDGRFCVCRRRIAVRPYRCRQIALHQAADQCYLDEGVRLLELARARNGCSRNRSRTKNGAF